MDNDVGVGGNKVGDYDEQLSHDIALAVASILEENEMYQRSTSDISIGFDSDVATQEAASAAAQSSTRHKNTAGHHHDKKTGKISGIGKSKVKKSNTDKVKTNKSKSVVKVVEEDNSLVLIKDILDPKSESQSQQRVFTQKLTNPAPHKEAITITVSHSQTVHVGNGTSSQELVAAPTPLEAPSPFVARNPTVMNITWYLGKVQTYINQLGYHRQGEPKIKVNTQMSVKHLLHTAKTIIKAGEQIKCLHALVLAIHFTNSTPIIERFPINFKSEFGDKEYKHVVLGIYLYGNFGALGISRDIGLQDKPPTYTKLSDMIKDFRSSYNESGHTLLEVKIGGIITHDPYSLEPIPWKLEVFNFSARNYSEVTTAAAIERCAKTLRSKMGANCLKHIRPVQFGALEAVSSSNSQSPVLTTPSNKVIATSEPSSTVTTTVPHPPSHKVPLTRSRKANPPKLHKSDVTVKVTKSTIGAPPAHSKTRAFK